MSRPKRDACGRGHPYPEFLYVSPKGARGCRKCRYEAGKRRYADPEGRKAILASIAKYAQTEKGKAMRKRAQAKYRATERGKENAARSLAKHRAKKRAEREGAAA